MSWFIIAIIAYLILAIVSLADKFLLEKVLPSSLAYTFLISISGLLVLIGAPFYAFWPGWPLFVINLLVGAIFPLGLILLYQALKIGESSRVSVLAGGSVPIFTLLLSITYLNERFSFAQWLALFLLIIALCLIIWLPAKETWLKRVWHLINPSNHNILGTVEAISAGLLFSIFFVGSKALYQNEDFASAFIFMRVGSALFALSMLLLPKVRKEIFSNLKKLKGTKAYMFFGNQALAAIGFSLQSYALSLGSVAIISALQGVQYSILIILGGLLTIFYPKVIKEKISAGIIIQKLSAVVLIAFSLYLLAK